MESARGGERPEPAWVVRRLRWRWVRQWLQVCHCSVQRHALVLAGVAEAAVPMVVVMTKQPPLVQRLVLRCPTWRAWWRQPQQMVQPCPWARGQVMAPLRQWRSQSPAPQTPRRHVDDAASQRKVLGVLCLPSRQGRGRVACERQ